MSTEMPFRDKIVINIKTCFNLFQFASVCFSLRPTVWPHIRLDVRPDDQPHFQLDVQPDQGEVIEENIKQLLKSQPKLFDIGPVSSEFLRARLIRLDGLKIENVLLAMVRLRSAC